MFGSKADALFVQACEPEVSAATPGVFGIGYSPSSVSAWLPSRYGQNVTAAESDTPDGQLVSATGAPFTGFSGTGGLYVVPDGLPMSGHTAGPGVGSVTEPVRRPHQSSCAATGAAVLAVMPSSAVLITPNALSVMLLAEIVEAAAATRRTPAPSRRFWLLVA